MNMRHAVKMIGRRSQAMSDSSRLTNSHSLESLVFFLMSRCVLTLRHPAVMHESPGWLRDFI